MTFSIGETVFLASNSVPMTVEFVAETGSVSVVWYSYDDDAFKRDEFPGECLQKSGAAPVKLAVA